MELVKDAFRRRFRIGPRPVPEPESRAPRIHVIILDGTLSSLDDGHETNAGQIYKLLSSLPLKDRPLIYYEEGVQWEGWRTSWDILTGRGINRMIQRAYGALASRYKPGDRIFLIGYSRGAYAARSLAGIVDRIGLIRGRFATPSMVEQLYRHYSTDPHGKHAKAFAKRFCHDHTEIEMVGVFDTVKALGLRLPLLWRLTEKRHAFHSHHLGHRIRHGFHALALHETREAFTPVLWSSPKGWKGHVEQVWFRGNHGDVGGQLSGFEEARSLSNIPLVWMLERAEACGLTLPENWHELYPRDADAPSTGGWRRWGKLFPLRRRRKVGQDPSERVHPTARDAARWARDLPMAGEVRSWV